MGTDNPDERSQRLAEGLERAQVDRTRWARERILAILAGVLVPLGVVLVLVGWHGASRTPNEYEQIPYLISGGQLGSTIALVGALCYFAHWLTALVKEHRVQGQAIVAAITHLEGVVAHLGVGGAAAASEVALVRTARGSLAHHPACSIVAGKPGLREVAPGSELARCRLCLPPG